jgi:hypothetical protein
MDKLLDVIGNDNCDVATSHKDARGKHQKIDKEALKANLKSKKQMQEIAEKLAVRTFIDPKVAKINSSLG